MNKGKKFIAALFCVMLLVGLCAGMTANAAVESVTDVNDLKYAIERANDGDTILFFGTITAVSDLGSTQKHIILKRGTAESCLVATKGVSGSIQNITFDGAGMVSSQPILKIQGDYAIQNCTFEQCGDVNNASSSNTIGGAVCVNFGNPCFSDCTFNSNNAIVGGHVAIIGNADVSFRNCTMKNGRSGSGGAISIAGSAKCDIEGCTITENETRDYGGGIANAGNIHIRKTKLFNNTTVNGGADIATKIGGTTVLEDSLDELQTLFEEDNISVRGWVCDYDFEESVFIPDVEPTEENLLKLDFEVIQPEEPDQPTEPGTGEPTDPEQPDQPSQPEPTEPGESNPSADQPTDDKPSIDDSGKEPDTSNNDAPGQSTPSNSTIDNSTTTGDTITNNSSSSSIDNSTSSNHESTTTDNSRHSNTTDSNNTSTVNNYYTQAETPTSSDKQNEIQTIVIPVGNTGSGEPIEQTITIQSPDGSASGNWDGATLNINVNLNSDNAEQHNTAANTSTGGITWYQAAVLCLLTAIVFCLLKRH